MDIIIDSNMACQKTDNVPEHSRKTIQKHFVKFVQTFFGWGFWKYSEVYEYIEGHYWIWYKCVTFS